MNQAIRRIVSSPVPCLEHQMMTPSHRGSLLRPRIFATFSIVATRYKTRGRCYENHSLSTYGEVFCSQSRSSRPTRTGSRQHTTASERRATLRSLSQ
jgi:hypothetical protein